MSDIAIQLKEVHKFYGKVHALRGLNLEVKQGEIFGFLGPNGAGKTTTIRCMLDLIRPNQGIIEVFGINPQDNPQSVKDQVGYLPGDLQLDGDFTPRRLVRFIRKLRHNNRSSEEMDAYAKRLGVPMDQKIKTLSQGNKQKVGLLLAFNAKVPLLMLDEPTLGLDPLMQQEVLSMVREQAKNGTTVFFSSHILSEVQKIADRVGIIRKGALVEISQTQDLISKAITRATVQFSEPLPENSFDDLPNVKLLRVNNDSRSYHLEIEGELDLFIKIVAKFQVRDMAIHRPSLEEVFLKYYKEENEEA